MEDGLEKLHNDSFVHLMHRISHAHLIDAKALDRPERVVYQMTACSLSTTLVISRDWSWNHILCLRMPCHNRPIPGIVSCNLLLYSLTMCCGGARLGVHSAQKISPLDPAPEKQEKIITHKDVFYAKNHSLRTGDTRRPGSSHGLLPADHQLYHRGGTL